MCLKTDVQQVKETSHEGKEEILPSGAVKRGKQVTPSHSKHKRNTDYDFLLFLVPALFYKLTPVFPIYAIGIARMISNKLFLTIHYLLVDKDNYHNKISQKQLLREKEEFLVASVLHMWAQVGLQIIFPTMFFGNDEFIGQCAKLTFWSHVLVVEPLYYVVHRWLHIPEVMKRMHGFHHLSINTTPATAHVQNFEEHFIYIATFGPAFLLPWLISGRQHWMIIGAYLILFDIINAWGHTNVRIRHFIFTGKYSPLKYLFYTPEFHLGHHAYFQANYGLFMPCWDHLLGTARKYQKKEPELAPAKQQDFVFIGHNGGLGHLLTCPEFSIYNVYDSYKFLLPMQVEAVLMWVIGKVTRMFIKFYYCPRYFINNKYVGRIICIVRTPLDFASSKNFRAINNDIVNLIRNEHQRCGTRYFGLGNWTKMKQLNNGGAEIADLVAKDLYLQDKNIRVWTGDTLTTASVYKQIMELGELNELFFIGGNGKIGVAVVELLLKARPDFKIKILSSYHAIKHPNVSYTNKLEEMTNYEVVLVGKILPGSKYSKALKGRSAGKTKYLLDYSVPFIPIQTKYHKQIKHIQIGLLESTNKIFLQGPFDICMSHAQNHIFPCHACCIINATEKRETNETGEINIEEVESYWEKAKSYGLRNRDISAEM